jgi:hypothetical protein
VQGPDFWPTPYTYIHTYIHTWRDMNIIISHLMYHNLIKAFISCATQVQRRNYQEIMYDCLAILSSRMTESTDVPVNMSLRNSVNLLKFSQDVTAVCLSMCFKIYSFLLLQDNVMLLPVFHVWNCNIIRLAHLLTLVPPSRIFSTLKMEAIHSSETSVHTRSTLRHIPKDGILHSHCRENLKSYIGV